MCEYFANNWSSDDVLPEFEKSSEKNITDISMFQICMYFSPLKRSFIQIPLW